MSHMTLLKKCIMLCLICNASISQAGVGGAGLLPKSVARVADGISNASAYVVSVPGNIRQGIVTKWTQSLESGAHGFESLLERLRRSMHEQTDAFRAQLQATMAEATTAVRQNVATVGQEVGAAVRDNAGQVVRTVTSEVGSALQRGMENVGERLEGDFPERAGEVIRRFVVNGSPALREVTHQITEHSGEAMQGLARNAGQAAQTLVAEGGIAMDQLAENNGRFLRNMTEHAGTAMEDMSLHSGNALENLGRGVGRAIVPIRNQIFKTNAMAVLPLLSASLIFFAGKKYIQKFWYEPGLIEKQYRYTMARRLLALLKKSRPVEEVIREHMVVSDQLAAQLGYIMKSTATVKANGGQFENVLLHGAPGTGKTLFAQLLAQHCGMDYAIVPAANVSQFLASGKAVEELNRLFDWAAKSSRGTILFFDECETFLKDRTKLSDAAHNALASFLVKTGTPSDKIMIVCATNMLPEQLDSAALSRLGLRVGFPLPDLEAREQQLKMHIGKIFGEQKVGVVVAYEYLQNDANVTYIAHKLSGCSGRTIQKFVNRLRQRALAEDMRAIDRELVDKVIAQTIGEPKVEAPIYGVPAAVAA